MLQLHESDNAFQNIQLRASMNETDIAWERTHITILLRLLHLLYLSLYYLILSLLLSNSTGFWKKCFIIYVPLLEIWRWYRSFFISCHGQPSQNNYDKPSCTKNDILCLITFSSQKLDMKRACRCQIVSMCLVLCLREYFFCQVCN